jgi:oligopeptide/dipeptide ABC transporter ATP-binding protein
MSLVQAEAVSVRFAGRGLFRRGPAIQALDSVSLTLNRGEALGLVGESGSGKSTLGRALLGLIPPDAGRVTFDGVDLAQARGRLLRPRMQLVFQDPHASLDPRRRIGAQIADGLAINRLAAASEIPARVAALLAQVGLSAEHAARFPHEFSGGQRQRIAIARALATSPDFLVADEPVSALDVSVQAQVLRLLDDLRHRLGLALLFISHDIAVVRSLCARVVVLYLGRVMEQGPAAAILEAPRHPYTRALLSAVPRLDAADRRQRLVLDGEPPNPAAPPSGCVFRTRCPMAIPACAAARPELLPVGPDHDVACIRAEASGQP